MGTKKVATAIIGACGEHYVASYLSGLNLIVAMPRVGISGFDLIVSKEKQGFRHSKPPWLLGHRSQRIGREESNLWDFRDALNLK